MNGGSASGPNSRPKKINVQKTPVGNLTDVTGLNAALLPWKLKLLHELLAAATNIAALVNTASPIPMIIRRPEMAAFQRSKGVPGPK